MSVLRVGFINYFPMTNEKCPKLATFRASPRCLRPGLAVDIWRLIAEQGNFTIEPVYYSTDDAGSWAQLMGDLQEGKVDSLGLTFEKTEKRELLYNFSDSLYQAVTQMAIRRVDSSLNSIFDFFMVYSPFTWLSIGLSLIFFIFLGCVVRLAECKLAFRRKIDVVDFVWRVVRLQLIQYYKIEFRLMAGSFSLGIFALLQCAIILSLYQSYIISSVVRTRNPKPFKVDELLWQLKQKKYRMIAISQFDWIYEKIHNGTDHIFYEYREAFKDNPLVVVDSYEEALGLADRGGHVLIYQSPFPDEDKHLMFRPNFPHLHLINKAIKQQKILIQRAFRDYMGYRAWDECRLDYRPKPLSFRPYCGPVILFLTGLLVAFIVFGGEFFHRKLLDLF